ncbi:hypothetical protein [Undibacterium sp. Tian12W]|uniref:hypothetical protein n=1 Tax=Undibacterium sp. Tian12W TaxID=3413054 RepID=UPI003BF20C27
MNLQKIVRVIAMMICLILMIGFGLCGLAGLAFLGNTHFDLVVLGLVTLGLSISLVCGFLLKKLFVSTHKSDHDKQEPG